MDTSIPNSQILSRKIKAICLKLSYLKQTAHLASALSAADLIACVFYSHLRHEQSREDRVFKDRFVLSKGHAASALYAALFYAGKISEDDLWSYAEPGSFVEEHPNHKVPGVDFPTGSLGHGLPLGCGMALGDKMKNQDSFTFVLMSDGECNEGTVWESAIFASAKKLNNLIAFVDHNKFQATGPTTESFGHISIAEAFNGFGWDATEVEGKDHISLNDRITRAKSTSAPSVIVCHTLKGSGISFMENDNNWHYKAPTQSELALALEELNEK